MSVFLIAEIGVNHNGSLQAAKRLIDAAKGAGADAAKFQLFSSEKLWGDDRIKHLELRYADIIRLCEHCNQIGIEFMCTPFGVAELLFLQPLLKRVKIASGCITRIPLLETALHTRLPVILSTGMSTMHDVSAALAVLGMSGVTLLQCTSSYPCRLEDANLRAMVSMRKELGRPVGFSDHTGGITVAIAATALGASVIEKHITLDRNADGPDHKASITPRELQALRIALIEVESAMGDGIKRVMPCEEKLYAQWRGH